MIIDIITRSLSENSVFTRNTLKVLGAYGIIQVFAQDIGVRTGCTQAIIIQNIYIQIVLFTAVAYSVTDDFYQSFSGTLIYFFLKYGISRGKLNDVCFPTECDTKNDCKD
jgi:hypothetical protein